MKNIVRSLVAGALLVGLFIGTAANAQEQIRTDPDGTITLTKSNQNDPLPDIKGKDILIVAGSDEFKQARLAEVRHIAALHRDKLLVIFADPQQVDGVDAIVAHMVSGPVHYPAALYIGPVLHNLVGNIPEGAITRMADRGLQGKSGVDTPATVE